MATLTSSSSSVSLRCSPPSEPLYGRHQSFVPPSSVRFNTSASRRLQRLVLVSSSSPASSSSSSFDDFSLNDSSHAKKSVLSDLIHEIEPLDVSLIQKDVPPTTVDAMKRTISGMLGLLPSNQFQVLVEALWEPLSKLLLSSMMTGYTLRNAEYRLCLERNLGIYDETVERQRTESFDLKLQEMLLDSVRSVRISNETEASPVDEGGVEEEPEEVNLQGLGSMSPEAQSYIIQLQSRLSSVKKELHEVKRKNAALQMQQFVGEEKNDLLDYLRSLQPEKVAELSEPTSPELMETMHSVVHGLLATLSPKMHSKAPPLSEKNTAGAINVGNEDCTELVENTSLNFQPIISLTRDYLARLLFWSMLLGHYLRGLEYRMELTDLFALSSSNAEDDTYNGGPETA